MNKAFAHKASYDGNEVIQLMKLAMIAQHSCLVMSSPDTYGVRLTSYPGECGLVITARKYAPSGKYASKEITIAYGELLARLNPVLPMKCAPISKAIEDCQKALQGVIVQ